MGVLDERKRIVAKTQLDAAAENLISCAGLISQIPRRIWDDIENEDQPYLALLEIVLCIRNVVRKRIVDDVPESSLDTEKDSTGNLLTCTPAMKYHSSEYWTPQFYDDSRTMMMSHSSDSMDSIPSLEDMAPLDPKFYYAVGQLLVVALQSSGKNDFSSQTPDALHTNDKYSLYLHFDAVRVLHIFSAMIDLNLIGDSKDRYQIQSNLGSSSGNESGLSDVTYEGRKEHVSFIDLLLYYVESCTRVQDIDGLSAEVTKVPIITSIFRHFSALPQLEHHVNYMTRLFRTQGLSATKEISSTNLKIEHMKKTEVYQERLEEELRRHIDTLEYIIGSIYECSDCVLRKKIRLKIGSFLKSFVVINCTSSTVGMGGVQMKGVENTGAAGVDTMLKILLRILKGIPINNQNADESCRLSESLSQLLDEVLIPLHKPSGFVLWRDQFPLVGLYHKTLVQCIGTIISHNNFLICKVIKQIIHPEIWPLEGKRDASVSTQVANTPKLVLLLHEIDTYISLLDVDTHTAGDHLSDMVVPLVIRLSSCIASDNSRSSERALEFFKNQTFKILVQRNLERVITPLLRALCRIGSGMEIPWNPTVKKMTLIVLREIENFDKSIFEKTCDDIFVVLGKTSMVTDTENDQNAVKPSHSISLLRNHEEVVHGNMVSLKSSMGSWRPPPSSTGRSSSLPSLSSTSMPPPSSRIRQQPSNTGSITQPPLTVTGVAPWAIKQQVNGQVINKYNGRYGATANSKAENLAILPSERSNEFKVEATTTLLTKGTDRIRSYMEKLKPPTTEEDEIVDGISSWARAQMSESPVLLPNLKFHDLVFGQILGTGAFSTVKYARQITKGKTRSNWPEYAVKIVSTQKIEELGYEKSINREVAVLRLMVHPSIARLVSSFRFNDGAYLILEYASGGDLHSLLKRSGSLDEDSTRFVVGEIIGALNYIHDLDFVYSDLKPENILITESGHIKLTDFGGCRPLTECAKQKIFSAGYNILKNLRDGGWRKPQIDDMSTDGQSVDSKHEINENEDFTDLSEDSRIEGTTAYLPPEVVLGNFPTKSADSWALGCVLFQCLSGRPPLLQSCDASTRQRIVTFDLSSDDNTDFFLESTEAKFFSALSKDLIIRLLDKDPNARPSMSTVATDEFFNGIDVYSLHNKPAHCLDAGKVAPSPDAEWSRRQFSSIWAPQPQAYNIRNTGFSGGASFNDKHNTPIVEGAERDGHFLLAHANKLNLVGILER